MGLFFHIWKQMVALQRRSLLLERGPAVSVEDQKGLTQEEHGTLLGRLSASVATLAALATLQRWYFTAWK
jgi:hypothetical protein